MIRVAINGYGRIGRSILRALYENGYRERVQIVAINELADAEAIAHLTQYDSSHGKFSLPVEACEDNLCVSDEQITLLQHEKIEDLPWAELKIDIVFECTGVFNNRADGQKHLDAGAQRVLFSHPATADVDKTIIYGTNHNELTEADKIVSNGSCTTNCVVPVLEVLDRYFTVLSGTMMTIHSAMNDQPVIDSYHSDLRRTRAAGQSIIPVDTRLAQGVERILPHMKGKMEAISVRVPTINVTAMDLSVTLKKRVNIKDINRALAEEADLHLKGILDYTEKPLVSCDFIHDPHSCIVDGTQTRVSDGHLVKLLLWCDNEWGFANRMLDTGLCMQKAATKSSDLAL